MKRSTGYSIQAQDIVISFWEFQARSTCSFINYTIFGRPDDKYRPCLSTLRAIDFMTQLCPKGTYFSAQHTLVPINNSILAWHSKAIMWAIWVNPQSWAHSATLQFPNPGGFGRRLKGMLDTFGLGSNSRAPSGPSRRCAPFAPEIMLCAFLAIFCHFLYFWPNTHYGQPPRARRTHGSMDRIWYLAYAHWSP